MANLTNRLTSISPDLRSGPSPGRRLLAAVLCAMLVLGSVFPGVALAGEADSEGEGTAPTVEVPVVPDFDPGGEETGLEEVPAAGGDEDSGAVEAEPAVDPVPPLPSSAAAAPVEAQAPQPVAVPEPATSAPAPEPDSTQQTAAEPATSEPVANQSIVAPKQKPVQRSIASGSGTSAEATSPVEPVEQEEAPTSPPPVGAAPVDRGRDLAGKDTYVVRPGDCLSFIAAGLLPADADTFAIEREVERLWHINKDRIGTGDPNLIYIGTVLRLH